MKKIVLLCALAVAVTADLSAQVSFTHTKTNPTGSVVNTGIDTSYGQVPGYYELGIVTLSVNKVSGTIAGKAILEFTGNGRDYYRLLGDTLTLSDVARNVLVYHVVGKPDFIGMRVVTTGTGTMSAVVDHTFVFKKNSF